MIDMKVKDRHIQRLALDGTTHELIKELALGVTYTLGKMAVSDKNGDKIPLSQMVIEFGQFLSLMGQHDAQALDERSDPHD